MSMITITDQEFTQFQRFIYDTAGITMSSGKKALVSGRLAKRLRQCGLNSYSDYFRLLASGGNPEEIQVAVDLLTTNETYFFREQKHFDFLRQYVQEEHKRSQTLRIWSAACSTGEEPYSIAMTLADCLENDLWEVLGSDISSRVLRQAQAGHYPVERTKYISPSFLQRFCLKGVGEQQGTLLVERRLRAKVRFIQANLNAPLPQIGMFNAIFLRNVMIYFNSDTKREVVNRVLSLLKPGGLFFIGHSESLHNVTDAVQTIAPSIYRKT